MQKSFSKFLKLSKFGNFRNVRKMCTNQVSSGSKMRQFFKRMEKNEFIGFTSGFALGIGQTINIQRRDKVLHAPLSSLFDASITGLFYGMGGVIVQMIMPPSLYILLPILTTLSIIRINFPLKQIEKSSPKNMISIGDIKLEVRNDKERK